MARVLIAKWAMEQGLLEKDSKVLLGEQYDLDRPLATGGAARLFLARQLSLDREVVVKILRSQLSNQPEFRERFIQEARLLAKLEHQNVVQVIDFGEQDGYYYIIMEYVRGGSVRDLIERAEKLPIDVALAIGYFVARGIDYVHQHQVLHLDVKPANILLTPAGVVKVADFGLARLIDQTGLNRDRRTPVGTPLYMSPEQVQGANLDARSDLFSFGSVLYQLLAQQSPFEGKDSDQVLRRILTCRVTSPSSLRPEIPLFVDDLVMGCLQRDRAQRYPDSGRLMADLHAALGKLAIHDPEERIRKYLSGPELYRAVLKKPAHFRSRVVAKGRRRAWLQVLLVMALAGLYLAAESYLLPLLASWSERLPF